MNNKSIEILMFKTLSGDISLDEQHVLDDLMKNNPELVNKLEEARKIECLLSESSSVDPPPEIEMNIMSAISKIGHKKRSKSFSVMDRIRDIFRQRIFKYTYAFGFGAVAAIILLTIAPIDLDSLHHKQPLVFSGTILDSNNLENFKTIIEKSINYDSMSGKVSFYNRDSLLVGILELSASQQISCNVLYPSDQMVISAISSTMGLTNFLISPGGKISFMNFNRENYIIQFRHGFDKSIDLKIDTGFENNTLTLNLLVGKARL